MALEAVQPAIEGWTPSDRLGDELERQYADACRREGEIESHYRLAGKAVRISVAGPPLGARLTPSFAHLRIAAETHPELTVRIWENSAPAPRTMIDGSGAGAFYHWKSDDQQGIYQPSLGALSLLVGQRLAYYRVDDATTLPLWERAAPIRHVLHWWLGASGVQQVHGGAVGTQDGGVLVVGQPGAGKSTTCLASLVGSLRYAGDDYVAFSGGDTPQVHGLYNAAKLAPDHASRFPHLQSAAQTGEPGDEKSLFFVHQTFPHLTSAGFPLKAVVMPRVVGTGRCRVLPASRAAALSALAPSTIIQLHTAGQEAFGRMRRLVEDVPAFTLDLGDDLREVPACLTSLIEELR